MHADTHVYPVTVRLDLADHQSLTDTADNLGIPVAVLARLLILQGLESATIRLPTQRQHRRCA